MGVCGDASNWAKVAALLELCGLPLFLSGYATPGWMVSETIRKLTDISVGLWQVNDCSSGSCVTASVPSTYKNGKTNLFFFIQKLSETNTKRTKSY